MARILVLESKRLEADGELFGAYLRHIPARRFVPQKLMCIVPADAASLDKDIEFILGFLRPLRPNIA